MLDYRFETFLVLSKLGSYTKTAQYLHITQPAVSQHIKYLEEYYGCKLFYYEGKTLMLTQRGKLLNDFAVTMNSDSIRIKELMNKEELKNLPLEFGVTLSIGEYIMPKILKKLINTYPNQDISMIVDNTKSLLDRLRDGKLSFVILEGHFDKSGYDYEVLAVESFIPVCSGEYPLANQNINFKEILNHRLLIREKGSGVRNVFDQILYENNFNLDNFKSITEIGNTNAIKELVKDGLGISFLYKAVVDKEIERGEICQIYIENYNVRHDFAFVYLKNSLNKIEYLNWLRFFKEAANS